VTRLLLLAALAACGQKARPDVVPVGSADQGCMGYAFGALQTFPIGGLMPPETVALLDSAQQHHSRAQAASKPGGYAAAARDYLACGNDYARVPEGQGYSIAQYNAGVCFNDAISAYAMGGAFGAEGKAALGKAAADHPQHADQIKDRSVGIKDCPTR
jgi:hypothetical protein